MGTHFIAGAGDIPEAQSHIGAALTPQQVWDLRVGGIVFSDTNLTDEEAAALFANFTPLILPAMDRVEPLPDAVRTHLQHLRDYLQASPGAITNAQTVHAVQDLIRAVHFLNSRFANEG